MKPTMRNATITIDTASIIGEVHDRLYGANLEHLGQAIYGGVWAEMLRDRKFAGHDIMYTAASEGLHNTHPERGIVVPWQAVNANQDAVLYSHDNTTFYTGRQSQRIQIRRVTGEQHGIKQGGLYLESGYHYDLRIVLKGESQAVTIKLGDVIWNIDSVGSEWQTYTHQFNIDQTSSQGELSITVSQGTLWIGCVSLMRSDHIKGFRPDIIDALREWSPTQLRWPGGNFVSAYHWQDGIGDRDLRPAYLDPAWWQWESHDMGTDEFIDLCRLIDAEPVLTINMGNGTVEEARAWVEYCNGDETTPYGKKRNAHGYETPHNVNVWFVGNEQFGNWQVGHVDAETYARRYLKFASAMRKVDPDLTLIGVGVPADLYGHWNERVLAIAGHAMDQLSVHYYSIRTEKWDTPPSPEHLFLPKIAAPHEVVRMLDETINIVDQSSAQGLSIAFDEWNTYYGAKAPDFLEDYNLSDALYTGAVLNACINRADRIKYSAIYHLTNAMACYTIAPLYRWQAVNLGRGGAWVPMSIPSDSLPPTTIKAPTTLVLELMTRYRGKHAVSCKVNCDTFTSPEAGNLPSFDDVPLVDASATIDNETGTVYLSIVNRDVKNSVAIVLNGLVHGDKSKVQLHLVSGDSPLVTNSFESPHQVAIETHQTAFSEIALPRHTYAMIVIEQSHS